MTDVEKREIQLLKQRIGPEAFPSTLVSHEGVVHVGNMPLFAALKRAEEDYIRRIPIRHTPQGNVLIGKAVLADSLAQQALMDMRALAYRLLDDPEREAEMIATFTRKVAAFLATANPG